jgi:hypothetical protein
LGISGYACLHHRDSYEAKLLKTLQIDILLKYYTAEGRHFVNLTNGINGCWITSVILTIYHNKILHDCAVELGINHFKESEIDDGIAKDYAEKRIPAIQKIVKKIDEVALFEGTKLCFDNFVESLGLSGHISDSGF